MKIRVDSKDLRSTLGEVSPFAKLHKVDKDVSRTAILKAEAGRLKIHSGSMSENFYVERTMEVEVLEEGTAAVELGQTSDALSALDGMVELNLSRHESGTVKKGDSVLPIRGSMDQVLSMEVPEEGWMRVSTADSLVKAAQVADKCRRQDNDMEFDLGGICLLPTDNGLELVGADRNHLIAIRTDAENCVDGMTICNPNFAKALAVYDKAGELYVKATEDCVWIKQGNRINVVGLLNNGTYVDYRQIVADNPTRIGLIDTEYTGKVVNLIRKQILKPTAHGLIRLSGAEDNLVIQGRHQNFKFTIPTEGIELPAIAVSASGLAKLLNLFDAAVELKYSQEAEQLYLQQGRKFAIIGIERDFFQGS